VQLEGLIIELDIEPNSNRMHEHLTQETTPQMPQVSCPDLLDLAPLHQLSEYRIYAVANATECGTSGWVRV